MTESRNFNFEVYRKGGAITWNGRREVISHVLVRRAGVFVYLMGHDAAVPTAELTVVPTLFSCQRTMPV